MIRIIPRDLFNDANLLKCLGALWIKLDNWRDHDARLEKEPDHTAFDIQQNEADGSTECVNVIFTRRGERFPLIRPMNSRESYPLWLVTDDDSISVFDDDGELSPEFVEFVSPMD